jgi:hypothetical protein
MKLRLAVILALATALALAAAPAQAAAHGCDLTGDAHRADDCITHSHVGATADGNMRRGDTISIREHIADALRGKPLVVVVQMRRVARDGTKGQWVGLRRTRWTAADTAAHAQRTVDVCRAGVAGRYEFRTETRVPQSALRGRSLRQASSQTATSAPTTVTLPNQGLGFCPTTPEDMQNVEYFNMMEFNEAFTVNIADQGTAFAVSLNCPQRETPTIPSPTFGMIMVIEGAPSGTACNSAPIVLAKAALASGGYEACQASTSSCTFDILSYNTTTQVVYSDSIVAFTLVDSLNPTTYIPNLNPATVPICPASLNPCVLSGACSLSTTKVGVLSLCEDAASCTAPVDTTYSYNSNVYFALSIVDKMTSP